MKKITPRHPLAVLRQLIGLRQKEMAQIAECTEKMVQGIELGTEKISERVAFAIHIRTGISKKWLRDGDPKAPPLDDSGLTYTRATFEKWKKMMKSNVAAKAAKRAFCALIEAIIDEAARRGSLAEACFNLAFQIRKLFIAPQPRMRARFETVWNLATFKTLDAMPKTDISWEAVADYLAPYVKQFPVGRRPSRLRRPRR